METNGVGLLTFRAGSDEYHVLRILSDYLITPAKTAELLKQIQSGAQVEMPAFCAAECDNPRL
jgi:hypothetical protein